MVVILGTVLALCACAVFLWQIHHGLTIGSVWVAGGDDTFRVHRNSDPLPFWLIMTGHVAALLLILSVTFNFLVNSYLWGQTAPTITTVRANYSRDGLVIYWDTPKRIVQPIKYVVHRRNIDTGEVDQAGSTDAFHFEDRAADQRVSYVYRVEAHYSGFTEWLVQDRQTISDPFTHDSGR